MPEEHTRDATWRRWCGTWDEMFAVVQRAHDLVEQAGVETRFYGTIDTKSFKGKYHSMHEFREAALKADRKAVRRIYFTVGERQVANITVAFRASFTDSTDLTVVTDGEHVIYLAGMESEMRAALDKRSRLQWLSDKWGFALVLSGLSLGIGVVNLIDATVTGKAGELVNTIVAVIGAMCALAGMFVLSVLPVIVPSFELLEDGERPSTSIWAERVRRSTGWAFTILLSGLVGFLISELLGQ